METLEIYRCSTTKWLVKIGADVLYFTDPDKAFDHLENLGVPPEETDAALIALIANAHNRAQFGIMNGNFLFSDAADPPTVGTS